MNEWTEALMKQHMDVVLKVFAFLLEAGLKINPAELRAEVSDCNFLG